MAALGVKIDLQEWWETSPQGTPHTFSLTAYANANLSHHSEPVLSERLYRALRKVVDATKPVRSHYEMTVAADFAQSLVLKDAMTAVTVGRLGIAPPVPVQPELSAGLGLSTGATSLGMARHQITPTLPLQQIQALRLVTKAAARGLSVIRLSMELRA
jgi:hypothetical protein